MALPQEQHLPTVVKSLGAVSFFNDFASEMVYPLIPALVTRTLGSGAAALGVLDGVAEAAASLAKLGAGWLADRPAWRRPMVVAGYLVATVTRPVMGLAQAAWQVIGLRATDRLGKGLRNPPRDAVIADAAPVVMRGRAFGFHRAMDHAGAVVGPLVATALLSIAGLSVPEVFVWSLVPGLVAVAVVSWALRGEGREARGEREHPATADVPEAPARGAGSRLLLALVVGFAFTRLPETLLVLRLQDLAVPVAVIPLLWAALHVVRTVASYPGGWVTDRLGPGRAMVSGWLIYAIVITGLGVAGSAPEAIGWFLAFGLVAAATESAERAFVARVGGLVRRGRAFGVYHASVGLAALPGGILFGELYQRASARTACVTSAVLALTLCVGLFAGRSAGDRWRRDQSAGSPAS
jgi:MFS family permease